MIKIPILTLAVLFSSQASGEPMHLMFDNQKIIQTDPITMKGSRKDMDNSSKMRLGEKPGIHIKTRPVLFTGNRNR